MRRTLFYLSVALLALVNCYCVENVSAQTVSKTEISCKDKNLRLVWDKIKNEFAGESVENLAERNIHDCSGLVEAAKVVDLNGDGRAEIIVHQKANCPASGNCMFWIFQKGKENDYQAILNADMIQSFALKQTKTNGYADIKLQTQNNATSHYFQLFKFGGEKYAAQKCWWEDYTYQDKKGNSHDLRKPRIHFEKCGEYDYVNSL